MRNETEGRREGGKVRSKVKGKGKGEERGMIMAQGGMDRNREESMRKKETKDGEMRTKRVWEEKKSIENVRKL